MRNKHAVSILTCNLRTAAAQDGPDAWEHRKDLCLRTIAARHPDIVCCQEMSAVQYRDMAAGLPAYGFRGMADQPGGDNPVNGIFYRRSLFSPAGSGGYWLSEKPHIPGSSSWDSRCSRLANWVVLVPEGQGTPVRVINTHLDHISQDARANQARLITEDAAAWPDGYCQLLTGDMNCDHTNPAIGVFRNGGWRDTYADIHGTENPGFTFHAFLGPAFSTSSHPETKIGKMDWIFTRGGLETVDASVITVNENGRYPSDHYFVEAVVRPTDFNPANRP